MECEHAFAIPCDCAALDKLMKMPCVGYMGGVAQAFTPQRGQYAPISYILSRLLKKALPIITCTKYFVVGVHWFFNPKNASTYYFASGYPKMRDPYARDLWPDWVIDPSKRECFFLGKYPVWWAQFSRTWCYSHLIQPGPLYPLPHEGYIRNVNMRIFKELPPDRWDEYATADEIQDYKRQIEFWEGWLNWQNHCLGINYPREYIPPDRWPGPPLQSLRLPSPDTPAVIPVPPAEPGLPGAPGPVKTPLVLTFSEVLDHLILEMEL